MTEYMELLGVVEAIAAGDMTRESMVELAMDALNPEKDAEVLFAEAEKLQHQFWDKLRELEEAIGDDCEIDATDDLSETSLEHLQAKHDHGDECGPDCPAECEFAQHAGSEFASALIPDDPLDDEPEEES